jgi:hypothetical protein
MFIFSANTKIDYSTSMAELENKLKKESEVKEEALLKR